MQYKFIGCSELTKLGYNYVSLFFSVLTRVIVLEQMQRSSFSNLQHQLWHLIWPALFNLPSVFKCCLHNLSVLVSGFVITNSFSVGFSPNSSIINGLHSTSLVNTMTMYIFRFGWYRDICHDICLGLPSRLSIVYQKWTEQKQQAWNLVWRNQMWILYKRIMADGCTFVF